MSDRGAAWLLVGLLALHAGLALQTMAGNSATFDEGSHLPAGYTHLVFGDHRLNPEQPPLLKVIAALPLLIVEPEVREDHVSWRSARQWEFGRRFLYAWNDGDELLFLGRLPMLVLTLGLIVAVFLRCRELAGAAAAVLAAGLAALSPDLLAHGNLVTTDVGMSLFFFLAVWAFDRLTRRATRKGLLLTGLATGAALAAKFSALVLAPVLLVLGSVVAGARRASFELSLWGPPRILTGTARRAAALAGLLAGVATLALAVVWASYGFRADLSPDPAVRAELRAPLEEPQDHLWQKALVAAAGARIVPEDYARGLLFVMTHSEGRPTFLAGQLSDEGFPQYFLATLAWKTPLPLLLLGVLAIGRIPRLPPRTVAFLWVPVAIYLGIALGRGLQIGHRHLLPILPFVLVAAAEAATALGRWRRPWGVAAVALLGAWYAAGTLRNHPYHLAYFNELAGGPSRGYTLLVDSNLDWGQDLKRLAAWMKERGVPRIKLSYFGSADPAYYGIDAERLPGYSAPHPPRVTREIRPGDVVAVSATNLQGVYLDPADRPLMERLKKETPVGRAGESILIYRAEFSWPPAQPSGDPEGPHHQGEGGE